MKTKVFPCLSNYGNVIFNCIDTSKINYPVHIRYMTQQGNFSQIDNTLHEWVFGISNLDQLKNIISIYCGTNNIDSQGLFEITEYDNEEEYIFIMEKNIRESNSELYRTLLLSEKDISILLHKAKAQFIINQQKQG